MEGPKPFSSDWYREPTAADPQPPKRVSPRATRAVINIGSRLPGERTLSVLMVCIVVIASFWFAGPHGAAHSDQLAAIEDPAPTIVYDDPEPTAEPTISKDTLELSESKSKTAPKLNLQAPEEETTSNGLLPANRIVTYYGFPGNADLGILGEYDMDQALELLKEQAAAYEQADPSRPVLPAFEVIASVAQKEPQADGSYVLDAPSDLLDKYAAFCEENGILLILDVQVGRRTVQEEVQGLEKWLKLPFVHLAIDPEFSMEEGQIPGEEIGSVEAKDVTWAQNYLVDLAETNGLPPKVLMVHQFHEGMIQNKSDLAPVPGVQLVIDGDGWGSPELKRSMYAYVNQATEIEYNGIKLFYKQDQPLLTPEEIMKLEPIPDVVVYQ